MGIKAQALLLAQYIFRSILNNFRIHVQNKYIWRFVVVLL